MTDIWFQKGQNTLEEKEMLIAQAYFDQKTVGEITELASRLIGNPVMVLDATYQCLACYPAKELGVPSWDMIISAGYMNKDVVIDMGRYFSRMTQEQRRNAYFYEFTESTGQISRKIVSGIQYNEHVLGGIAVAEYDRPLQEEDLKFCDYLCKVFASLLYKEFFLQKSFNQNFEQIFWDILSKQSLNTEILEGRLEALGLVSVRDPFYLVYVDILPAMKRNVDYIRIKLKELYPDFFTVFYQDSLLIIGNISNAAYSEVVENLGQFSKAHGLFACISNAFPSLTSLRDQYSLVRQACSVGQKVNPQCNFFEFKHLNLYCLLQEAADHFSLQNYLHPAVHMLKAYDKENNTDYHKTLITYLENNLNLLATANQLFIHRNTLSYRLKKIGQLLNLSLEDKNVCLNLLLSYLYDDLLYLEEKA